MEGTGESIMNKFCALGFSLLLCLAGCKDSEKKPVKEQTFHADQKKLMDEAKSWGLTNLETLGMTLDSTTEDQAFDILKSRGYAFVSRFGPNFIKSFMNDENLKKIFSNGLLKNSQDKLKKSSIMFVADSELFQKEKDKSKRKDFMFFAFDENKKLIMFFKQYPENKEAGLVIYEGMNGSRISNKGEEKPTYIFRKDRSLAIIGKKDLRATSYIILAPSIVGKYVGAFNKAFESIINTKEFKELSEKEKEFLKGLEGEEYRKQREIFRNSEEYKILEEKIKTKIRDELSKNSNKSSPK